MAPELLRGLLLPPLIPAPLSPLEQPVSVLCEEAHCEQPRKWHHTPPPLLQNEPPVSGDEHLHPDHFLSSGSAMTQKEIYAA